MSPAEELLSRVTNSEAVTATAAPLIGTASNASGGQASAAQRRCSALAGGSGEDESSFVRERQTRLVALYGEPRGSHTCTSVCTVRPSIPLTSALKLMALEGADSARVSAKPSHQRSRRSAEEGQSRSSSEHEVAPLRHVTKKNWYLRGA